LELFQSPLHGIRVFRQKVIDFPVLLICCANFYNAVPKDSDDNKQCGFRPLA
jgi:hypothetical protein